MSYYDQLQEAADAIRARVSELPAIGVVLGSGLGDFAAEVPRCGGVHGIRSGGGAAKDADVLHRPRAFGSSAALEV